MTRIELDGSGDTPSAFDRNEPLLCLRDVVSQLLDFRLEESFSRAIGIPIGFKVGDRLSALSGERLLAGLQGRSHARFQFGNPLLDGGDARSLLAILTDRQGERLLGPLDRIRNRYEDCRRGSPGCGRGAHGVWCDHPGQRRREHESVGRPMYSMS